MTHDCDTCAHDRTGDHRLAEASPSLPHCLSPMSVGPSFWEGAAMVECPGWVARVREYGGGTD